MVNFFDRLVIRLGGEKEVANSLCSPLTPLSLLSAFFYLTLALHPPIVTILMLMLTNRKDPEITPDNKISCPPLSVSHLLTHPSYIPFIPYNIRQCGRK